MRFPRLAKIFHGLMKLVPGRPSFTVTRSGPPDPGDASNSFYRVIRTARTLEEINPAVRLGYRPLLKHVVPSPEIHKKYCLCRHRETGEIRVSHDLRDDYRWGKDYDRVLSWRSYYQYHFPSPFAAYLVPPDIQEGEVVFLADLIEDFVEAWGAQGDNYRLKSYFATWTNGNFRIDYDAEKEAPRCLG